MKIVDDFFWGVGVVSNFHISKAHRGSKISVAVRHFNQILYNYLLTVNQKKSHQWWSFEISHAHKWRGYISVT